MQTRIRFMAGSLLRNIPDDRRSICLVDEPIRPGSDEVPDPESLALVLQTALFPELG